MNATEIGKSINKSVKHTFTIEIMREMTEEQLQYIFDCWCEYWTCDFGYQPNEYSMVLQ